ncbi:hypothetical protein [Parapedobacter soli]|uniref:hypothetical protein n=1 Tax=Parapedobacter soli TaxID=416955 RepID=UPI0021C96171|nr:hypothetical protein [Parapedobacter soli]
MRITVKLNLHDDFLLTCETMHVDVREAIKCYTRNVKLFEATHDENNTIEFKATKIFFCVYLFWCLSQDRNVNEKNSKLALKALDEVKQLKEEGGMVLHSPEYQNYINRLFNKLHFNYGPKKNNARSSK